MSGFSAQFSFLLVTTLLKSMSRSKDRIWREASLVQTVDQRGSLHDSSREAIRYSTTVVILEIDTLRLS